MAKSFFSLFPEDSRINRNIQMAGFTLFASAAGGLAYHTVTSGVSLFSLSFSQVATSILLGFCAANGLLAAGYSAYMGYNFVRDAFNNVMNNTKATKENFAPALPEPKQIECEPKNNADDNLSQGLNSQNENINSENREDDNDNQCITVSPQPPVIFRKGRGGAKILVEATAASRRAPRDRKQTVKYGFSSKK